MSNPSQPDTSSVLLAEKPAIGVGVVVTIIGAVIALFSIGKIFSVIGSLVLLIAALYVLGIFAQFWLAKSWKDGLTVKELTNAVLWPVGAWKTIREGQRGLGVLSSTHLASSDDTSATLLNQPLAIIVGVVGSVLVVPGMFFFGLRQAADVTFSLIWLVVVAYVLGAIFTFWAGKVYKDGLTTKELLAVATGPIGLFVLVASAAKRRALRFRPGSANPATS